MPIAIIAVQLEKIADRDWLQLVMFINTPIAAIFIYWLWRKNIDIFASLRKKNKLKNFLLGLILGGVVLFLIFLTNKMLNVGSYSFHPYLQSEWLKVFAYFSFLVVVCLITSFFEELFFRGLLLRLFKERTNTYIAVIYSSILFALLHPTSSWLMIIYFIAGGLAFGVLYARRNSIFAPIGLHFIINFFFHSTRSTEFNKIFALHPILSFENSDLTYNIFSYTFQADSVGLMVFCCIMLCFVVAAELFYLFFNRRKGNCQATT